MTPRSKAQFEKIRSDRKQQIMDTALELFSREGYGHVSIATLAKASGISKGLMYNYFESKEQLLNEIIEQGMQVLGEIFDPNQDGEITSEEFEHLIRMIFKTFRENPDYWSKYAGLLVQPNISTQLRSNSLSSSMNKYMEMLMVYLERKGFEDPMLEMLHLSVIFEGLGIVMIYYRQYITLPDSLLEKFEERIIQTYK